ncbi:MAG: amidohydrolase family protein [Pseudomonadota bacterium]
MAGPSQWADPKDAASIIDAHVHLWPAASALYPRAEVLPQPVSPEVYTDAELFGEGLRYGIARTVGIQHIGYYGYDNRYLLDLRERMPDRIAVIGAVGEREPDGPERLEALVRAGARGVRVRGFEVSTWPNDPHVLALWHKAQELGALICPLLRVRDGFEDRPLPAIAQLCERFPELNVIIDHMAFVDPRDDDLRSEFIDLARFRRIHVKTSGFEKHLDSRRAHLIAFIRELVEAFGPERLMWGSDMPVLLGRGGDLSEIMAFVGHDLGLTSTERGDIMRGTAERLFFP